MSPMKASLNSGVRRYTFSARPGAPGAPGCRAASWASQMRTREQRRWLQARRWAACSRAGTALFHLLRDAPIGVPRAARYTPVAGNVTGTVGVSAGVRSRWIRWAPNFLPRTAVAPLAITDASPHATRQGRRSDNHHDCRAEKQFLHDALPLAPPQDSLGIHTSTALLLRQPDHPDPE